MTTLQGPPYGAHSDNTNQQFSILGVIGTLGTADTQGSAPTLPIGVNPANGALYTHDVSGGISAYYDSIYATYPDGTTEVYTYQQGTTPVGTTTVTYLDTAKGSINSVIRS